MCTREEGGGASTSGGQLLLHGSLIGHAGKKRKLCSKCPLEGVGAKSCPWSAPRRPESWSSTASGSLGVLSQGGDPPSLKSLRGLCHQVTCAPPPLPPAHTGTHTQPLVPSMGSIKCPWPAGEGMVRPPRQQAHSRAPNKGGGLVGGVIGSARNGGGQLGLGRDVAPSLTGHQQPQHLLFLTSKGNRFVSD